MKAKELIGLLEELDPNEEVYYMDFYTNQAKKVTGIVEKYNRIVGWTAKVKVII